jgi:hypothetical protein
MIYTSLGGDIYWQAPVCNLLVPTSPPTPLKKVRLQSRAFFI